MFLWNNYLFRVSYSRLEISAGFFFLYFSFLLLVIIHSRVNNFIAKFCWKRKREFRLEKVILSGTRYENEMLNFYRYLTLNKYTKIDFIYRIVFSSNYRNLLMFILHFCCPLSCEPWSEWKRSFTKNNLFSLKHRPYSYRETYWIYFT